jgi:hypothetical protein
MEVQQANRRRLDDIDLARRRAREIHDQMPAMAKRDVTVGATVTREGGEQRVILSVNAGAGEKGEAVLSTVKKPGEVTATARELGLPKDAHAEDVGRAAAAARGGRATAQATTNLHCPRCWNRGQDPDAPEMVGTGRTPKRRTGQHPSYEGLRSGLDPTSPTGKRTVYGPSARANGS